ncbi:MAG: hypothetical protein HKN04_15735, partial [Rhodothermaceae bacterium]|nr:hypothetical protein [Rhodothermaceae bacterium]
MVASRFRFCRALLSLFAAASLVGCVADTDPLPPPDYSALRSEWQVLTAARDSLFRSEASPLLPTDRAAFDGLAYFAYDSTAAFSARVYP